MTTRSLSFCPLASLLLVAACTTNTTYYLPAYDAEVSDAGELDAAAQDASTADTSVQDASITDATSPDAADANASKAAACANAFGTALPEGFGRLDGTLLAVVGPTDQQCTAPNSTHIVLQVLLDGAAYRMVVNVVSDRGTDRRVYFAAVPHGLPAPAWSPGFHTGVTLTYPTDLGLHVGAPFEPVEMGALVTRVTEMLTVGAKISVYAQGGAGGSKHIVHRDNGGDDGAIVLDPDGSPRFLAFHFLEQTF